MSNKLLKFSRSFWETAVAYGGSDDCVLRHYDVLKALNDGLSIGQISIKYGLTKQQIHNIKNNPKYK